MIGEKYYTNNQFHRCPFPDAQAFDIHSALSPKVAGNSNDGFSFIQNDAALQALMRYLPSNSSDAVGTGCFEYEIDTDVDLPADAFSSDNFRMYDFKVRSCARGGSHDWTDCPYAHPGEKARRRDPRKYYYSGTACPEFRKGSCRKGDACEFAHGVFECWLHPARYRTQPCKDGLNCNRRVCFFAHAPEQLRVLSPRAVYPYDGAYEVSCDLGSTPSDSPPMSPINGMVASLRQLQLSKINSLPSPCSATMGSPRLGSAITQRIRPGFWSLPATPTRTGGRPGLYFDRLEEAPMERVESGRDVRAKMFEKIGKENPLNGEHPNSNPYPTRSDDPNPDVGWVSELVQ